MKIKAVLTGATGMVGEGVLHECLFHPEIEEVLVIGRKACGKTHPRLKEIIVPDLFDLSAIEDQLKGYDACFFCVGVSSVGMKEETYTRLTYDLTMSFARSLLGKSPEATFCYISGAGTDSSEKGKSMWARVKGKTENDLATLGFRNCYLFRPGYMQPTEGLKNTLRWYRLMSWMYPLLRAVFPKYVCSLRELGWAMINAALYGYRKNTLEVKDIVTLAHHQKEE